MPTVAILASARGSHLDTVLDRADVSRRYRRLESRLNPQAGKPALRSADILVGPSSVALLRRVDGFWGLPSPQVRTVSRCTRARDARFSALVIPPVNQYRGRVPIASVAQLDRAFDFG